MSAGGRAVASHARTVDDYLGLSAGRFFGQGYKRAEQRLRDIVIDEEGVLRARASVVYPDDWSVKGERLQRPHLSSIDVLLLAAEAAEVYLTHAHGLNAGQRAEMRLRRVRLKAGRAPVEDENLREFDVTASVASGSLASVADCHVGFLRARCEIEHPASEPRLVPARFAEPDKLLGPGALRPFARAHKAKTQLIENLRVAGTGLEATARLATRCDAPSDMTAGGLESYSFRATSILDVFVAAVQLAQILLYELDGVDRMDSNTLWMRQTVLEIADPGKPAVAPGPISVRLEDPQILTGSDEATWRIADIVADFEQMSLRCSAAHRLPSQPGRADRRA